VSNPTPDDRIRERFQRLRSETEQSVPSFQAMLDRAREQAGTLELRPAAAPRPRRRRLLWASGLSGAAIAAALAAVLLTRERPDADAEFDRLVASFASDAATGAWRSPTDALLNVPGSDLTRSLPSIGGTLPGVLPPGTGL
jgi:ferric-dicitrate binding protein FerR (iron transport regulator)